MGKILECLFVVILAITFSRFNTIYNSELIFKRYVALKNKKLAELLIADLNPDFKIINIEKEYKDRLLISGIVFYILTVIFSIGLFICLLTGSEYREFFFDIVFSFAFFGEAFNILNTSRYRINNAKYRKWAIFTRVLSICGWFIIGVLLVFAAFISFE